MMSEMKYELENIKSRLDQTDERIRNQKQVILNYAVSGEKRMKKPEESLPEFWNIIR